jgi:hypothetical protein
VLASFTNLVGTLLEARLWDVQRFKGPHHTNTVESDKQHAAPVTSAATSGEHPTASVV